jgi:hypothetical protein
MIETIEQKIRRWRLRAEEMRVAASGMRNPDAIRDLAGAAASLERMADRVEQLQAAQAKHAVQLAVALDERGESHPTVPRLRLRRGASRHSQSLSLGS